MLDKQEIDKIIIKLGEALYSTIVHEEIELSQEMRACIESLIKISKHLEGKE